MGKEKKLQKLTKKQLVKIDKGIHRKIMMDMGVYALPKAKTHKDKKKYSRKKKIKPEEEL